MNRTLDYWFGTPKEKEKISKQKNIFYFDSNTMESKWLNKKPKDTTFNTIVKWNEMSILLCTNLKEHDYLLPVETVYNMNHITYLKSNLQKCIRRKLNDKAIKTAHHLIKLNINEFLRRISIIIIEDVILHQSYSTIVWLMAATSSKKTIFKPNKYIIDWLLGLVNTLCDINECDHIDIDNTKYDITKFDDYDLLYSLQFRIEYGGMNGDIVMLNYITGVWFDRFRNNKNCNTSEIHQIDSDTVIDLSLDDWKLDGDNCAGIDFHCAPYIIDTLSKRYNTYLENKIQTAIWNCSSGINYRKLNEKSERDIEIWNVIEKDFYKLQQNVLYKKIFGLVH
ncbi:hypothetical protein QKU48_gp0718 [Fadolivirus algeromassiliense]|jgi:hypothetical protein|uniref:Uncharacterized protein n=1 Tax=Fadolivirus FV1/VV64 TaxID=3070911 RepID=A0A7D3V7M6_9VIRU|nr:hypothetical protein QKU48_gp0718 [Fadolivirus algeromassiliense]QKF94176.1 hypothetical protein Fadolivirus_1_718 [Fadolivirus FV1/VV64]